MDGCWRPGTRTGCASTTPARSGCCGRRWSRTGSRGSPSGRSLGVAEGPGGWRNLAALSHDGRFLALGGDNAPPANPMASTGGEIWLWDLRDPSGTPRRTAVLPQPGTTLSALVFTPDGT